jgi:threonine synthase
VILVATSGDTGSAVAQGFFGMKNVRVILLYPSGKVSHVQEQQLTTIGGNVTALEIDGSFDDCQKLVKEAFLDSDLNSRLMLSSANSINIARLIPQMFYYFRAVSQLKSLSKPIVFSVPSGNFGNLTAGLFAKKMGLPISHFVASTNINDVVPQYLDSGNFSPRSSAQTLSNAMDVGNPSNFARMLALYGKVHSMRFDIYGSSYSDAQTLEAISRIYKKHHYVAEPHGAIGWLGLESYRKKTIPEFQGIFLETAHPAKFPEAVKSSIGIEPELPQRLKAIIDQEKKSILMQANFADFKSFLLASS